MNFMDQSGRMRPPVQTDDIFGPNRVGSPGHDPALISMGALMAIVQRGKWVLLSCLAAALGLAVVYLARTPPEFSAASQVILEARRLTSQEMTAGASAALDSAQAESQMQVVKSERILSVVFDTLDLADAPDFAHPAPGLRQRLIDSFGALIPLHLPIEADAPPTADALRRRAFEAFADRVSVRRIGQSYVLEITFRAATAVRAAQLTNAITAAYIHAQIEQKVAAARRGAEFLEDRFAALREEEQAAADAIHTGVIPATPFPDSDARVISAAREPLGKSAPQTGLVLLFASACGLLLGGGTLAVRHSLDRRIRSADQVWHHIGLPCLSVLPTARRSLWTRVPFDLVVNDPKTPFSQALRSAYTSIVTAGARDAPFRTLGIVSWRAGEGKSTIAGNLAHFIAAAGETAVLVDADLQDPALSQVLAPDARSGLSEALLAHADPTSLEPVALGRGLCFVPASSRFGPNKPNVFLGAPHIHRVLDGLRSKGDVIVDLPAMMRSPDAQAIGGFLDAVVLVVECGRTTIDDALAAVRTLENAQARVAGVVLNKAQSRRGR